MVDTTKFWMLLNTYRQGAQIQYDDVARREYLCIEGHFENGLLFSILSLIHFYPISTYNKEKESGNDVPTFVFLMLFDDCYYPSTDVHSCTAIADNDDCDDDKL